MRLTSCAYAGALIPKTRVDYIEHLLSGVYLKGSRSLGGGWLPFFMPYKALLWASLEHLFECFKDTTRHVGCQFGHGVPDGLIAFGRGCGLSPRGAP